jgi:nucleotide-binding universal stress UspA family protein
MTPDGPLAAHGFSHVVHPTDFSAGGEPAFVHALRLALAARGHFYLVHAEELEPGDDADWGAFPGIRSTLTRWGLLAPDADPGEVHERLGLRATKVDIPDDDPVDGVLRFVDRNRCDFLVVATHAREGLARLLQGSVAETLARKAQLPTLFLPLHARGFVDVATGAPALRNILVPIDSGTAPGAAAALALRMADALDCDEAALHSLHVGPPEDAPVLAVDPEHEPRVRRTIVKDGSVVETIVDHAARLDAELIVMATRGRDGLMDHLRGSTTEQVLRQANRALLAVPAG